MKTKLQNKLQRTWIRYVGILAVVFIISLGFQNCAKGIRSGELQSSADLSSTVTSSGSGTSGGNNTQTLPPQTYQKTLGDNALCSDFINAMSSSIPSEFAFDHSLYSGVGIFYMNSQHQLLYYPEGEFLQNHPNHQVVTGKTIVLFKPSDNPRNKLQAIPKWQTSILATSGFGMPSLDSFVNLAPYLCEYNVQSGGPQPTNVIVYGSNMQPINSPTDGQKNFCYSFLSFFVDGGNFPYGKKLEWPIANSGQYLMRVRFGNGGFQSAGLYIESNPAVIPVLPTTSPAVLAKANPKLLELWKIQYPGSNPAAGYNCSE